MNIPAKYRQAIYIGTAVVMALLIGFRIVSPEQVDGTVQTVTQALGATAAILAALNLTPDDE